MNTKLHQHLRQLGVDVDVDAIIEQLSDNLTLSIQDGVLCLFASDNPQSLLSVDFMSGALSFRSKQHLGGENLIKACRIKGQEQVKILDATCGLGTDSFLLHQAGFKVTATEYNPLIWALLADGLHRYQNHDPVFELVYRNATDMMATRDFDVIYLDPMFPVKTKSAKTKKTMQLFQAIHQGSPDQATEILKMALSSPSQRVVIKRPSKSALLTNYKPTFQVSGKTCRFDVYQLK